MVDWLVAVGNAGAVIYSSDRGASWQVGASGTTQALTGVAFVGNGRFVAVGASDTMIYSDDGGKTWTSATTKSTGGVNHQTMAFGNGRVVAVGTVTAIWTSADRGVNWSAGSTTIAAVKNMADFVCNRFLMSSNAETAHSSDGITFTLSTTYPAFPAGKGGCLGSRLVIASAGGLFSYYSDDAGVNWNAPAGGPGTGRRALRTIGSKLIAFGDDVNTYQTSDGSTWSAGAALSNGNIKDAAVLDANRMVAVGGPVGTAIIQLTADAGGSWTQVTGGLPTEALNSVAFGQIPQ